MCNQLVYLFKWFNILMQWLYSDEITKISILFKKIFDFMTINWHFITKNKKLDMHTCNQEIIHIATYNFIYVLREPLCY